MMNAQSRLYVKANGGDNNKNGYSWENAIQSLDEAFSLAKSNTSVQEIWVAKGTYIPEVKAGDGTLKRDRAFVLPVNVKIYGGFEGNESEPSQRYNGGDNGYTVLSGIIGNTGSVADSVYHVVLAIAPSEEDSILLDGFTISGGCAKLDYESNLLLDGIFIPRRSGGGIYTYGNVSIINNTFKNNVASNKGGGIYVHASNFSSPSVANINYNKIIQNIADVGGGAYFCPGSSFTLPSKINVGHNIISENRAITDGGGFKADVYSSNFVLNNNMIVYNKSTEGGGACIFAYRVSAYATNPPLSLDIYNNTVTGNDAFSGGGLSVSIDVESASVNIKENMFSENSGYWGGGGLYYISESSSTTVISDNTMEQNTALNGGGANISNFSTNGTIVIENNSVRNNTGSFGGGLYISSEYSKISANVKISTIVRNNKVTGNKVDNGGGGIYTMGTSVFLYQNFLTDNTAQVRGGGLFADGRDGRVNNNTIIGNFSSSNGGGIYSTSSNTVIDNNLIANNTAFSNGGGLYAFTYNNMDISNNTIVANNASVGGAGAYTETTKDSNSSYINLSNTIFWGNKTAGKVSSIKKYRAVSITNCLLEELETSENINMFGTSNTYGENPLFVDYDAENFRLKAGSPAINAGNNEYVFDEETTDMDNNVRISNNRVDIGAYEYGSVAGISTSTMTSINYYWDENSKQITIQDYGLEEPSVSVYSICGQLFFSGKTSQIDMSIYPNDIYLIRINDQTLKVIKQ